MLFTEVLVSFRQIFQVIFKDIRYHDGLNRDGIGQISCNTVLVAQAAQLEETSLISENTKFAGLVEGTETWMCVRRCCTACIILGCFLDENNIGQN